MKSTVWTTLESRRAFIGGSDARIIMGSDEPALQRLWREKRGEVEPQDLSNNLLVQLGLATEHLNRHWYERTTGQVVNDIQSWVRHPVIRWMAATLDGVVEGNGAVFEAKFMLPWSFSEEAAAEKHMAQLQHNMWVTNATAAVLSIITGGGKSRPLGPIIIYTTLTIPEVMMTEAFLSFLGLGTQEPLSSWGLLAANGADSMDLYPWTLIFPAIMLAISLFCFNFLGDGLRDALDPRIRKD